MAAASHDPLCSRAGGNCYCSQAAECRNASPKPLVRSGHAAYWDGNMVVVSDPVHAVGCAWEPEVEHCTCGALVLTRAYKFANGGVIAFDQHGRQMPYYQQWHGVGEARIRQDWPAVDIPPGEMVR